MNVRGQHVLITGGAGGVGTALARAFLDHGSHVTLLGRDFDKLTRAERELQRVDTVQCDLTDARQLVDVVRHLGASPRGLGVLVNNAAVQFNYDFTSADPLQALKDVEDEIRANFTGLVQLTTLALPLLRQQASSAVVNVTSGLAVAPKKSAAVYSATKAAVRTYTKALRYQVQDAGLKVLVMDAVLPLVDTPMTTGRGEGRKVRPDVVARAILSGIARDRRDVHVGLAGPFMVLHRALPGVAERLLRGN